jgi:hypothetical protein
MIYLASTSDKLQVITSSANPVHVHASYVDLSGSTVTPSRANTSISAAATTDVVASPGASTTRKIKFLSLFNDHATAAQDITIRHTDGTTTADLWAASVPAQSGMIFDEKFGWRVMGAETPCDVQVFDAPGGTWVKPASAKTGLTLIRLWGAGGGGGGGASLATAVVAKGGAGGGGGLCLSVLVPTQELPATMRVIIGIGGPGGLGATAGGSGSAGSTGGASSVTADGRVLAAAFAGTGGAGGANSAANTTGGTGAGGHNTTGSLASVGFSVQVMSGNVSGANGPNWEGGGSGGGSNNSSPPAVAQGGNSRWGGGGGGTGGCHNATPAVVNATAGGGTGNGVAGTAGGLGGAAGTSGATPTAGANGTDTTGVAGGTGGGGGGTTVAASTAGGNGGNGGKGGGGGGGGGVGMDPGVGGNGGNGGNGFGWIATW